MTTQQDQEGGSAVTMRRRKALHVAITAVCDLARQAAADGRDTLQLDRALDTLESMATELQS